MIEIKALIPTLLPPWKVVTVGCSWEHPGSSPEQGVLARSLPFGFASAAMDVPQVFVEALRSLLAPLLREGFVPRAVLWLGLQIGVVDLSLLFASDVIRSGTIYAVLG